MNGWTKDLSQQERDENELRAIGELLQSDPTNEYWRARFENAPHPVDEAQRVEREIDAELSLNPRTQMLIAAGCLNADGSLKPYIATGHKSQPLTVEDVTDFFGEV